MQTPQRYPRRAIWIFGGAIFAVLACSIFQAKADDLNSIPGFGSTAAAFLDLSAFTKARLMVYRTKSNTSRAFVAFEVEGRTFSYASDIGSHYCPVDLDATAKSLAEIWCREPVQSAVEISPKEVLKAGYRPDPSGNYPNGCLVDSLLHFTRLPDLKPEADWEGVFVLFAGVDDWHTDHALLIYFVGPVAWVYDPNGRRSYYLGKIDFQAPLIIARQLDPEARAGGWLETRDLAWIRKHAPKRVMRAHLSERP